MLAPLAAASISALINTRPLLEETQLVNAVASAFLTNALDVKRSIHDRMISRCSRADAQVRDIFSDHIVLQKTAAVSVWGTAAGEGITVTVDHATTKATA